MKKGAQYIMSMEFSNFFCFVWRLQPIFGVKLMPKIMTIPSASNELLEIASNFYLRLIESKIVRN